MVSNECVILVLYRVICDLEAADKICYIFLFVLKFVVMLKLEVLRVYAFVNYEESRYNNSYILLVVL